MKKVVFVTLDNYKVFPTKGHTPWPDLSREASIDVIPQHWEGDIIFTTILDRIQLYYIPEEDFNTLFPLNDNSDGNNTDS